MAAFSVEARSPDEPRLDGVAGGALTRDLSDPAERRLAQPLPIEEGELPRRAAVRREQVELGRRHEGLRAHEQAARTAFAVQRVRALRREDSGALAAGTCALCRVDAAQRGARAYVGHEQQARAVVRPPQRSGRVVEVLLRLEQRPRLSAHQVVQHDADGVALVLGTRHRQLRTVR
eukprot:CAMPEP_0196673044 /NCGR_PEP_ID=MMETSP1090-20130531/2718_1 /TAXON_ID=37098 /ORGANISM="Isochrysis sp, Strain CCMP1244" /LENGTH=175 /DNA_ID=CAMNT_0042010781 /DNA_START=180 /DNA_END=707 /DNA_ORIENTATION=-